MNILELLLDRLQVYAAKEYSRVDQEEAKCCLLDYTGVALAGAKVLEGRHKRYLEKSNSGIGDCAVIGTGVRTDAYSAAFLNALSAHVLELDDGQRYGMVHPGAPVISALLPVAEQCELSSEQFLKAIAVGYEATIRLACMVQPEHKKRGFHATATCGAFGAAMAVGFAKGYDEEQLRVAASAALTGGSGLLAMIDDDSEMKPYNCAQAAVNGLLAANAAQCGYRPPKDALGGNRGFFYAMNGDINEEKVRQALEMKSCLGTIYRKMYASCRHTHPPVEAALHIRAQNDLDPVCVEKIEVETYDLAVYGHVNTNVDSISAAKMSTPYAVSIALARGLSGLDAFTEEMLENPEIQALAGKVSVCERADLSALAPERRAAVVKVSCLDGRILEERVDYPKGEPENPLTEGELREKFMGLASYAGKSSAESREILEVIQNIECRLPRYWDLIR